MAQRKPVRTRSPAAPRRVALAFPVRLAHLHTVVQGIGQYAQENGGWIFTTSGEAHDLSVRVLRRWQGDGIIAVLDSEPEAEAARRSSIPVVTFVGVVKNPGIPRVMMDQSGIGKLAAQHLLARGFRHFAFYGVDGAAYSLLREAAYASTLASREISITRYLSPNMLEPRQPWDDEIDALCKWLKRLPSPIGIFAANDARARMIADACRIIGRAVPSEVGIIGVDNSQLDCEFGSPKLTTIQCDWFRVGFETARLLDKLMQGADPPVADQLIPPTGVIPRESTDVTVVDHPIVARAVAYTREHLNRNFGVKALVAAAGVSRRYLETSFAAALGITPSDFIARIRIERAKQLLGQKGFSLTQVARDCGFTDSRQFRRVFLRVEKTTPRQYQKSLAAPQAQNK